MFLNYTKENKFLVRICTKSNKPTEFLVKYIDFSIVYLCWV